MKSYKLMIGSYGKQNEEAIQFIEYDVEKQSLQKISAVSGIESPSYLTKHPYLHKIYAVSEVQKGEVASYHVDTDIRESSRKETGSVGPCHVLVEENGEFLLVANFGGGSISLHPLSSEGEILANSDLHSLKVTDNPSHPHMCYSLKKNNLFLITDLGQDLLFIYALNRDSQKLEQKTYYSLKEKTGPRHLQIDQNSNTIYIANEFSSTISIYKYSDDLNELNHVKEVPTIPESETKDNFCADIHFSPKSDYLYVSNRGRDSIVAYKVLRDGDLLFVDEASSLGNWPRNFIVTPDGRYIFVANEHSNNIAVLQINQNGTFKELTTRYFIPSPTCVKVWNL